jgi:hypothetical protein
MRDFFESGKGYLFGKLLDFLTQISSYGFIAEANACKLIILRVRSSRCLVSTSNKSKKKKKRESADIAFSSEGLCLLQNKSNIKTRQAQRQAHKDKEGKSKERRVGTGTHHGDIYFSLAAFFFFFVVMRTGKFDFPDLDPAEVADQLTLIESEMFMEISPTEFFNLAWKGSSGKKHSPNVCAMVERFNLVRVSLFFFFPFHFFFFFFC